MTEFDSGNDWPPYEDVAQRLDSLVGGKAVKNLDFLGWHVRAWRRPLCWPYAWKRYGFIAIGGLVWSFMLWPPQTISRH